jgi:UDP-N-acetylmuramoylalanine--D-glutamate ligase
MKKLVILGAGESGTGAAVLAQQKGYDVFVSDSGAIAEKHKSLLCEKKINWEEKIHSEELILSAAEIIKSPGIPDEAPLIRKAKEKGIPVISEIEFAGRHTKARMICITGSNGKTTTTLLTHHILKKAGLDVGLGGNVGKSLAMLVAEGDHDYYVVELSSFQLDGMYDFKADVAILLNITPDHLDRYNNDMQQYTDSKFRIVRNQSGSDAFIYCADDSSITGELKKRKITAQSFPFSILKKVENGAWLENDNLQVHLTELNTTFTMSIYDLALQGKHNLYNSMAACIAANILNIRKDTIRECLADFQNVEHRLEFVASVHGVDFINDSKATNVNSTWYALESMNKPVIWIAGGVDKGNDYSMLKELVADKVKAIICLGKDNKKIHKAFRDVVPHITDAKTALEAVKAAYQAGKKGDVVLLSPACASFDLFQNFEDRGRQFKAAVKSL